MENINLAERYVGILCIIFFATFVSVLFQYKSFKYNIKKQKKEFESRKIRKKGLYVTFSKKFPVS